MSESGARFLLPITLTIGGAFLVGSSVANLVVANQVEKNKLATDTTTPTAQTIRNIYWMNVFILFIGIIMLVIGIWGWVRASRYGRTLIRRARTYVGGRVLDAGGVIYPEEVHVD